MDLNHLHHTISPGSAAWWLMNAGLLLAFLFLYLLASVQHTMAQRVQLGKALAWLMLINLLLHHVYFALNGNWTLQGNLPLHLCSMSAILAIVTLYTRWQGTYEFLIYWSAGAIHSFLTPELTHGMGIFEMADYCISHGGIIFSGVYCTVFLGMRPKQNGWVRILLLTQLCLPVIGLINYLCDANYMYISQRPNADNPLIVGEWPWYIIGLELVMVLHFVVFYHLHRWLASRMQAAHARLSPGPVA